MWFLLLWVLGILTSLIYFMMYGIPPDSKAICSVLLLHQFVVTFGFVGILGALSNIVFAKKTAKNLGLPGGIFQIKYGFSQVGLGVMGVMAIWFKGSFWLGAVITMYIYGLSGLWSHTQLMIDKKKLDRGHVFNIIIDILYQAFITILSVISGVMSA